MPVVTVSRQLGSRGDEIAAGVAERLSLRFVDREIIHRAASEAGVPQAALAELSYEGQRSLVERVLGMVNTLPVISQGSYASLREAAAPIALPLSNILTPATPIFTQLTDSYVRVIGEIIRDLANQGKVLIVGRGGQVILRDRDDTLHVRIMAPFDRRVETIMRREGISRREARARVIANDRARSEYVRRYYNANWADPSLYDLVINTDKIDWLTGIEIIVRAQMALKRK
jgi:cytidylate kinase